MERGEALCQDMEVKCASCCRCIVPLTPSCCIAMLGWTTEFGSKNDRRFREGVFQRCGIQIEGRKKVLPSFAHVCLGCLVARILTAPFIRHEEHTVAAIKGEAQLVQPVLLFRQC